MDLNASKSIKPDALGVIVNPFLHDEAPTTKTVGKAAPSKPPPTAGAKPPTSPLVGKPDASENLGLPVVDDEPKPKPKPKGTLDFSNARPKSKPNRALPAGAPSTTLKAGPSKPVPEISSAPVSSEPNGSTIRNQSSTAASQHKKRVLLSDDETDATSARGTPPVKKRPKLSPSAPSPAAGKALGKKRVVISDEEGSAEDEPSEKPLKRTNDRGPLTKSNRARLVSDDEDDSESTRHRSPEILNLMYHK